MLVGQDAREIGARDQTGVDEDLAEPPPRASLFQQRFLEVARVNETLLDEKLSERAPREVRRNGHDLFCIGNPDRTLK
jgi:hypothetical protein